MKIMKKPISNATACMKQTESQGRSLLPLLRRIGQEYALRIQQGGIPVHTAGTLMEVYLYPEKAEPAQLADESHIPRQTMTFILDSLERYGMVVREPHPADRRRKIIRVTPKGAKTAQKLHKDILQFESRALAVIPQKQIPVIRTVILKYIEALEEQNKGLRTTKPR